MSRLIIATLITMLASPAFAADVKNAEQPKKTKNVSVYQGVKKMSAANKAYYEKAAAEEGVVQSPSGLLYKSLKEGNGATPDVLNTVKVHFRATLINGKEFNSSYKRNLSENHRMNRVFVCWQEGLQKMKVGGKAKLVCPPELAFKAHGVAGIVPPNAIVTYEIELLGVK